MTSIHSIHVLPNKAARSVPEAVSARQIRLALLHEEHLAAVEAAVAASDEATKISWEYSAEVRRDDPAVVAIAVNAGLSLPELDHLFKFAAML